MQGTAKGDKDTWPCLAGKDSVGDLKRDPNLENYPRPVEHLRLRDLGRYSLEARGAASHI